MVNAVLQTGDIWLAALDPTVGSEIQKTRPCVVISPNEMHQHLHCMESLSRSSQTQQM